LDSDYSPEDTEVDSIIEEKVQLLKVDESKTEEEKTDSKTSLENEKEDTTEEENSCSSDPCGANASCWNGDGRSFLCTCDTGFPHGNPYNKCVKCLYDSHCPGDSSCVEDQCVGSSSQGPDGFVQVSSWTYFYQMPNQIHSVIGWREMVQGKRRRPCLAPGSVFLHEHARLHNPTTELESALRVH
jgi:hypothetical protein